MSIFQHKVYFQTPTWTKDSSITEVVGYGLDDRGSIPDRGSDFLIGPYQLHRLELCIGNWDIPCAAYANGISRLYFQLGSASSCLEGPSILTKSIC
jgi:hypothetical protein